MTMRQLFLKTLHDLLDYDPGIVVIHSALANLAPPTSFSQWDILYGLFGLVKEGWTIALPAFTFSFCTGRPFHYQNSCSEVGVLADWLLTSHPDAARTRHPIYSFALAGPATERLLECPSSTTFGDDSPFGFFESENAKLVMLGCGWEYATQFHRYEEKAEVPYRYFRQFTGRADMGDGRGERDVTASMYVRELAVDPINDFSPAVLRLRAEGLLRGVPLWRGRAESAGVADMARICQDLLKCDPMSFVGNASEVAYRLSKAREATRQSPLKLAILGSSNVHLLRSAIERELSSYLADRRVETFEVPYGQLSQALLDTDSELRRWQADVSIFCDRLEDLLGQGRLDNPIVEQVRGLVEQYAALISAYHAANGGWTLVHRFALLYRSTDENAGQDVVRLTDEMNSLLESRLVGLKQVLWLDVTAEAASGSSPGVDFRLWHLGRIPYSEPFSRQLARCWAGKILAVLGKTARAIVVDLDNTLWGGILGEDGLSGVRLGGDYPGNAFLSFQRVLKRLAERGIAIAICSKNDEDLALNAIDRLPAMQFRSTDIAAHRINWQPKWSNIRDIASELNLGIESILFLDDNPVEREAVKQNLPGVKVLEMPDDPAAYAESLMASPWVGVAEVTPEDRKRVQSYRVRRQVEQQRSTAVSLEDFYASLGMRLYLQPLAEGNIARAAQLCVKTNQFNTTTRRYDKQDLWQIAADGGDVVVLGLEDRYSELENIGLIILRVFAESPSEGIVDNYLLSCRVLGRGLETAVLDWALRRASSRQWNNLRGIVIETERNTPVRSVFADAGFQPGSMPGEWMAPTFGVRGPPKWLTIIDMLGNPSKVGIGTTS